jgi:putative Holliday junction resolvase
VRIGIDVGSVRVGVARTDPDGVLAVPVATLARPRAATAPRTDLTGIADLVEEYEPLELVVGLPLTLDGAEGPAAAAVRAYVADLLAVLRQRESGVRVRLVDERLSTAAATRGLREAGRDARSGRGVVDQAAAVIILQTALDTERATGTPAGALIDPVGDS